MTFSTYKTIGLEQLGAAQLQNRIDAKFPVGIQTAQKFLTCLSDYNAVEIGSSICLPYQTLYYDTKDYDLFRMHQRGKSGRIKFRSRKYSTGDIFHETKIKNNKGRTIKKRIEGLSLDKNSTPLFPKKETLCPYADLHPSLMVYYDRITLAAPDFSERITVDFNLSYEYNSTKLNFPDIAVIELKRGRTDTPTRAKTVLRELRVSQCGFSKYCIGIAALNPDIPQNFMKNKFRYIDKLSQEVSYVF